MGIVDRIQHLVPALKMYVPGAILVLIGLMFLLVTLALGLGALVGQLLGRLPHHDAPAASPPAA